MSNFAENHSSGDNVFFWRGDWIVVPGKNLKTLDLHYNPNNNRLQVCGVDSNGTAWTYVSLLSLSPSIPLFLSLAFSLPLSPYYPWPMSKILRISMITWLECGHQSPKWHSEPNSPVLKVLMATSGLPLIMVFPSSWCFHPDLNSFILSFLPSLFYVWRGKGRAELVRRQCGNFCFFNPTFVTLPFLINYWLA